MAKEKENINLAKAARAEREKLAAIDEKLLEVNSKINAMTAEQLRNSKEAVKLFQQGVNLEKEKESTTNKILDLNSKISELSKKGLDDQKEVRKLQKEEYKEYWEKLLKDREDLKKLDKEYLDHMDKSEIAMKALSDNSQKVLETTNFTAKAYELSRDVISQSNRLVAEQGSISDSYFQTLSSNQDTLGSISDIQEKIAGQVNDVAMGEYQVVDLKKLGNQIAKDRASLESKVQQMSEKEYELALQIQAANENALKGLTEQQTALSKMSGISQTVLGKFEKIGDSVAGMFSKLPGGDIIGKAIGADKISQDIKEKLGGSVVDVVKSLKGDGGLVGAFKAAGSGLGSLIKMGPKLAMGLGIGAIVAGIGGLVKMVMAADQEVADLGKEFGVSYDEARKLHHEAIDISNQMNIVGINAGEVAKAMGDVSEMFGGVDIGAQLANGNENMKKLVEQTAVLTKQFGMSGQEVSQINDIATITGVSMDQLVKESVELGKGTMSTKASLKALSSIPPQIAVAFKGSTKELIAASQKAKMLGMELSKVQSIGRGMLDIESSLEAELEAQVITGKNLNLDKARMLALNGDIFGLQEEILNQAGSLEEFTKMNTLQQESMAKAMGMSVEEMTKMLTNAQKLKDADISSDYASRLASMEKISDLEAEAAKTSNQAQKDYILQLAAEKRSASLKETMADLLTKIKQKFAPIIDAVLEVVGGLKDGQKGVGGLEEMLGKIDFKEIADQIKAFLPKLLEGFGKLIQNLPKIIEFVTGFVDKLSGAGGAMGGLLGFINPSVAGFGAMALKVAGPGGIAKGFEFAGKGAMSLLGTVKGPLADGVGKLGDSVKDKLGGAFGKVADKAKSGLGKVMEGMGKGKGPEIPDTKAAKKGGIGDSIADFVNKIDAKKLLMTAAAILVLALALVVAAKGFQEFGKVSWEGIAKGVVGILSLVGVAFLLDKIKGQILMGAAAILVLGAALVVAGVGFTIFAMVPWEGILKGVVAIGAVAAIAVLLGTVAPLAMAGAAALIVLSGAVLLFGAGMLMLGEGLAKATPAITAFFDGLSSVVESVGGVIVGAINAIGDQINKVLDKLLAIGNLDPGKLMAIGGAITVLGGSLAAFGGGSGLGAIADGLGGLFGGDSPFDQIISISEKLKPEILLTTAIAIRALADSFQYFADKTSSLKDFDTNKLDEIIDRMEKVQEVQASAKVSQAVEGAANAIGGFISGIFGGGEEEKSSTVTAPTQASPVTVGGPSMDMSKVEQKLDTLIGLFGQVANQPTVIKFGDKFIEEIKGQINLKKSFTGGLDNTYGRSA